MNETIDDKVDLGFKYKIQTCEMDDLFLDPNRPGETAHSVHKEIKTEDEKDAVYDIYVMGRNYHESRLVLPQGTICVHVITYNEGGQKITAHGQFHEYMVRRRTEKLSSTIKREKGHELDIGSLLGNVEVVYNQQTQCQPTQCQSSQ